jgi:hypothetical protein
MKIQRQAETFSESPHAPRLEDLPDSAYHQPTHLPARPEDWNPNKRQYEPDPYEHNTPDEESGYNWGPPPDRNHIRDPGFREVETETYPFE